MTRIRATLPGTSRRAASRAQEKRVAPVPRRVRQLALAYHLEALVETGVLPDYAEAARRLGVSRARVSQLLRLRYLPARTQELLLLTNL